MADPLTIVGGIAAIIQISYCLTTSGKRLKRCIKTVRYAPEEVKNVHEQISQFSMTLIMFYNHAKNSLDDMEDSSFKTKRRKLIAGLIRQCTVVQRGFEQLLKRFFLTKSRRIATEFGAVDRIVWLFRKSQVEGLRLSLESVKASVILYVVIQQAEDLRKKIKQWEEKLQKAPEELVDWLRTVKRQLKGQKEVIYKANMRIQQYFGKAKDSDLPLIPNVKVFIRDTLDIEEIVTREVRKEIRRNRQVRSSLKHAQGFSHQNRDPSPGSGFGNSNPSRNPSSPPDSNFGVTGVELQRAPSERTYLNPVPETIRSRPRVLRQSREMERNMPQPRFVSPPPRSGSVEQRVQSDLSQNTASRTFGPIVHDNGEEVWIQDYGEWKVESHEPAPELPSESGRVSVPEPPPALTPEATPEPAVRTTESVYDVDTASSSSRKRKKRAKARVQGLAENQTVSDGVSPLLKGESSPYKAIPPLLDEDWKGVRRPPSGQ